MNFDHSFDSIYPTATDSITIGGVSFPGGLNLPSGTTIQRSVAPIAGATRWNTTLGVKETFNGTTWTTIVSIPSASLSFPISSFLASPTGSAGAPSFRTIILNDSSDVLIASPSTGQILSYSGTKWVNTKVQRSNIDVVTTGQALATKIIAGTGITLSSSSGVDVGTGDVTVAASSAISNYTVNTQTASYSLVVADGTNTLLVMNVASANIVTIQPNSSVPFVVGTCIQVTQYGAGKTSIVAGSGVTVVGSSLGLRARYSTVALIQIAINTWEIIGDTDAFAFVPNIYFNGATSTSFTLNQSFSTIPITQVTNVGGGTFASNIYTIPVAGVYDISGTVRIADSNASVNVGLGIGTVNADSPNFYWATNSGQRWTFQYSNRLAFNAGDQIRFFGYADSGTTTNFIAASFVIKLIG